jgi:hypothetical protein
MRLREKDVCVSRICRREIEIEIPLGGRAGETSNPTCTCGAEMKKVYSPPVFQKLSKSQAIQRVGVSAILEMQKTLRTKPLSDSKTNSSSATLEKQQ